jgi:phosphoglycerol transferase MdoB-like AlkP superfamily enzyme
MKKLHMKLNWKEIKMVPVYLLTLYFLFVMFTYLKADTAQKMNRPSTYIIIVLWLILTLFSLIEIEKVKLFFVNHAIPYNYVILILSPVASFLVVETMVSNYNLSMFRSYTLYNLIWYVLLYYLMFALIRSCRYTIAICNITVYLVAMLNYFVYLFRGNPILPSDLLAWQTGMRVASGYHVSFTLGFIVSTLIMYFVFVLGYKIEKTVKKPSVVSRIIIIGTFLLFLMLVHHEFFNTNLIQAKIRVIDFFAPKYTYCSYGTAFGFVANVKAMETKEPDGYSALQVQNTLENVPKGKTDVHDGDKPNIIVIMNEAFSDLNLIGDFKTNMDYLPFIHSLSDNTTKGTMYTSVFGGGTSDTEYEFLTGNSMAVMPQNSVPYQQFVTSSRDSLARTLKDQGYYNIAMHPYISSDYKRDIVYPLLGFDEFLSMDDFVNPIRIRNFISDQSSYQKIIEQYETKGKDNPLFVFDVTMQNHGGYSGAQLFDDDDTVRLTDYKDCSGTEQYLSLLRQSDKALQMLVEYFKKQKEHTIILLFGDHQPIAYTEIYNKLAAKGMTQEEELSLKYKVPFILWANYDIEEDDINQISANYLSSYLLQTAGLNGTTYNDYLMNLYDEVPVMNALFYIDKDNIFHSYSENTFYSEDITKYKYVGYNNALDKSGRLSKYYYLP